MQDITNNKRIIRLYFNDKEYNQTKITIAEKKCIITDEKKYRNFNE